MISAIAMAAMAILTLAWAVYYGLQDVADAIRESKEKE
jgi:hypothetical protein